jgi:peptide/nickel transport system ATP-binding protein
MEFIGTPTESRFTLRMNSDQKPILEVKNLKVNLKLKEGIFPVANHVSFSLYPGKTLALVGESGCGKTMTALSLLKLNDAANALPPEGAVLYQGENLLTVSEKRLRKVRGAKISMVFQDPTTSLNPLYTIGNQLMEVLFTHFSIEDDEAYERCIEALRSVGIPDPVMRMEEYPHELSGGMRQRVMIAMAILCNPEILIADEPTTALDVTIQAQVLEVISNLQQKNGMSVLLITHDLGIVGEMADDVAVMYATEIVESGSMEQIFHHPSHPYTKALFAASKREKKDSIHLDTIQGSVPPLNALPSGCKFHTRCPYVFSPCYQGEVPNFCIERNPDHLSKCWLEKKE